MARNRIVTELRADSAQLRSEFAKAQKKVGDFNKGLKATTKTLVGFAAGAIGIRAGIGVFSELGEKFDRVGKLSNRFNLPVEEVQKLSIASELTGTNIERMTAALTKATVSGVEASKGLETYSRAFADLNIDVDQFNQADASEKISLLSRAFANAENESVAFTAAYRILGKAGADLIPLLRENADGIERLSGSLRTLSDEDVSAIEAFNDEMALLKANLQAELAKAFAGSLSEVKEEISALGKGLVQTTAFLIEHKDAIKTLVKVYLAYKGIKLAVSKINVASGFLKSSLGIAAETAAIQKNTLAIKTNGAARSTGLNGLGRKGQVGAVLTTAAAGFGIGNVIGNLIADANGIGDGPTELEADEEIKKMADELLKAKKIIQETNELSKVQVENENFRNQKLQEAAKLHEEIAARRAEARRELKAEVNQIAAGVLKTELGYKSESEQLEAQREKLADILEKTRAVARANGFDAPGNLNSNSAIELAREAAGAGRLEVSRQLLLLAQQLQEKKSEILDLEDSIKSQAEAQKEAAAEQLKQSSAVAKSQKDALREEAQVLTILKLKAAGRIEEAEALEKEIKLRADAQRIAERTGLSEEKALALVRKKNDLQLQLEKPGGSRPRDLDNRFDEDGNRKLARDGRRKKIVLIRRDANGNRIDSAASGNLRASLKARAAKANPLVPRTDRLVDLAEKQLGVLEKLQTSS